MTGADCARAAAASLLLLAGCANIIPRSEAVPNPPTAPEAGLVVLFNGLTFFSEGNQGTGTYALAEAIRRRGIRAEIDRPGGWEGLADLVLSDARLRAAPIAVYGYSAGAQAAAHFAERLGTAGVPVQTLVATEAYGAVSIPCNVRDAVHFYVAREEPSFVAARPGCARVTSRRFAEGSGRTLNHFSASSDTDVLTAVQAELLEESRVRPR